MILALVGQKGGSGKSTLAVCLAVEAMERGRSVLLVDADQQGSVSTWAEVASERGHKAPTTIAMGANMAHPDQLPRIASTFDVIIIDCPGRADAIQRAALMLSHAALLPCGPSAIDAWALASSIDVAKEAQVLRPDLHAVVAINRRQPGTLIGRGAREALEQGGLPVLRSELVARVAFQEALAMGQGVTTYAPLSDAASEVRSLYSEILKLVLPKEGPTNGKRTRRKK